MMEGESLLCRSIEWIRIWRDRRSTWFGPPVPFPWTRAFRSLISSDNWSCSTAKRTNWCSANVFHTTPRGGAASAIVVFPLVCLVQRSQSMHDRLPSSSGRSSVSVSTRAMSSSEEMNTNLPASQIADYHDIYNRILPYVSSPRPTARAYRTASLGPSKLHTDQSGTDGTRSHRQWFDRFLRLTGKALIMTERKKTN